jgi:hypothetical protein
MAGKKSKAVKKTRTATSHQDLYKKSFGKYYREMCGCHLNAKTKTALDDAVRKVMHEVIQKAESLMFNSKKANKTVNYQTIKDALALYLGGNSPAFQKALEHKMQTAVTKYKSFE